MSFREYKIPRDPNCPVCSSKNPTVTKPIDYLQFCGIGRGEDGGSSGDSIVEEEEQGLGPDDISVDTLKKMRDRKDDFVLVDVRNPDEVRHLHSSRASVKLPLPERPLLQRFQELPEGQALGLAMPLGVVSSRAP